MERRRQASRGKIKWSGLPKRYGEGGLLGFRGRDGPPGERMKRGRWARGERGQGIEGRGFLLFSFYKLFENWIQFCFEFEPGKRVNFKN
jgi:hypothetical protein